MPKSIGSEICPVDELLSIFQSAQSACCCIWEVWNHEMKCAKLTCMQSDESTECWFPVR